MFRIWDRQIEAFERHAEDDFVARESARLRKYFDAFRDQSDEEVARFVRLGISRAAAHGIEDAIDVADYVGVMAVLGEDFETAFPWARAVLERPHLYARTKMSYLTECAIAYDEARAKAG